MSRGLSLCLLMATALSTGACEKRLAQKPHTLEKNDPEKTVKIAEKPLDLSSVPYPDRETRLALFDELVSEIVRVDAEGLEARRLRTQSWPETIRILQSEMGRAESFKEMARVLTRLDATYTNLHSHIDFVADGTWFDSGFVRAQAEIVTKVSESGRSTFQLDLLKKTWETPQFLGLKNGDEILSLNGRSLSSWSEENYTFCKFALRSQCDEELFENFLLEKLSWQRGDEIKMEVRSGETGERITLNVPYEIQTRIKEERAASERSRNEKLECSRSAGYPGFHLAYAGNRACIFEKDRDSSIAVLRITSFSYSERRLLPEQNIRSMERELELLTPYWNLQAGRWQHLVIDVIDNTGGNAPIPYYQQLFTRQYQEQYYRFKKIPELEDPSFLKSAVWEDPSQIDTYAAIRREGAWDATPFGSLLPPVPMFCAKESGDCRKNLFEPSEHPFRGRVSLLMNRLCISSCDGFVWGVKKILGDRVKLYGQPQAADSTYARARIDVEWSVEKGFTTRVVDKDAAPSSETLFSQVVAISLSTDAEGKSIAGRPLPLDRGVSIDPFQDRSWHAKVLEAALSDRR